MQSLSSALLLFTSTALSMPAIPFRNSIPEGVGQAGYLPPRYHNNTDFGTYLYTPSETFNQSSNTILTANALDGKIIVTPYTFGSRFQGPSINSSFGNLITAFYPLNDSLQLYTSSIGEQVVYVGEDTFLRYTAPGAPVPKGAVTNAISFFDPLSPLPNNLPSASQGAVHGNLTLANGTTISLGAIFFCTPTEKGFPPLSFDLRILPDTTDPPAGCTFCDLTTTTRGGGAVQDTAPVLPPVQYYLDGTQ